MSTTKNNYLELHAPIHLHSRPVAVQTEWGEAINLPEVKRLHIAELSSGTDEEGNRYVSFAHDGGIYVIRAENIKTFAFGVDPKSCNTGVLVIGGEK